MSEVKHTSLLLFTVSLCSNISVSKNLREKTVNYDKCVVLLENKAPAHQYFE